MREILFRGKSAVNGEWVEGYYVKTRVGKRDVHCIVPFGRLTDTIMDNGLYQVIPETVGEYTGLNDSHDEKIFEGDVVHAIDEIDGSEFMGYVDHADGSFFISGYFAYYRWMDYDVVVIGNIHDNPEMMEGGQS